jgi:hypothetical protein
MVHTSRWRCSIRQGGRASGCHHQSAINPDKRLPSEAQRLTGLKEPTALIHQALTHQGLRALIECESAWRPARSGGSEPQLRSVPRWRTRPA